MTRINETKEKPNIIFFFSDQQRWDTVGCYGQELNLTPNLDMMAEKGVRFEHAFTCQPVCGPARACIQTGKYATEIGCFMNGIALPPNEKTIANYLSQAGYEVGYIGKWHLASTIAKGDNFMTKPIPYERRGGYIDYWLASDVLEFTSHGYDGYLFDGNMKKVNFKGYRADCITEFALSFLRTRNSVRPFFLFISYVEPHHQNDKNRYEGPTGSKEKYKDCQIPKDLVDTEGDWKENYPDYLGCCARLDNNLGKILTELNELGIADNTVIFYASDHGSHFRTRNKNIINGNDDYKRTCHESAIRIPLVVCGPGFAGGKVINELVSIIDIPPTFLACAEIEKPDNMRGRPLQELVEGKVQNWPQDVFIQISESQVGRAIRTKMWKYSVCAPGKTGYKDSWSDVYMEEFLYDLGNDQFEKNNLINNDLYAETRKELANILIKRISEIEGVVPKILAHKK